MKTTKKGGKRAGAGRPTAFKIPGEQKTEVVTVKLFPSQKKYLEMVHGSIQKAVDNYGPPD